MKKILGMAVAVLAVSVLVAGSPAEARGMMGGGEGPGGCWMGKGGVIEKLNLTPEQTKKVADLRKERFKDAAPLMEKMFGKRNEMRLLWSEPTPNQEKIAAVQKEMRDLKGELQAKGTSARIEFLKMLTPEQRAKLDAGLAGPGSRRGGGCQMGGGPGFGPGRGGRI